MLTEASARLDALLQRPDLATETRISMLNIKNLGYDLGRQLAQRCHKSATVPLDVHPTGERVRRRRPVFYRWLFTRRVRRKRWLKWVHLLLFRRSGPNMQSPTAGFRFIQVTRAASLCSIGNDHPSVPTCLSAERRAQRQSKDAAANAAAPAEPAHSVFDRASTVLG